MTGPSINNPINTIKIWLSQLLRNVCIACILISVSACGSIPDKSVVSHPLNSGSTPTPLLKTKQGLHPSRIAVVSWNVRKGSHPNWREDLKRISTESDLVPLQEAVLNPELADWLKQDIGYWSLAPAFKLNDNYAGVLTAGSVSPKDESIQWIMEPFLRLPKMVLIHTYDLAGHDHPLLVVNTHGVNFTTDTRALLTQLENIAIVLRKHPGPILLAGDFNTWSDARMKIVDTMADNLGLQAVQFSQRPATHFGKILDHIYYRGLEPLDAEVVSLDSSDHLPLTATFTLPREQAL